MPQVSVVMPGKNVARTLAATLDSLVAQSFQDFELVFVNDGSSDETEQVLGAYEGRLRLRVVTHPENLGVAQSINDGLAVAQGELIARLDADDLAMPERLAKQVAFMQAQPHIDVCGTQMEVFSDDDPQHRTAYVLSHPTQHAAIRTALIQRCALAHPSVMARRALFDQVGAYNPNFDFAEDYELWCRCAMLGRQFANLPEPLTRYRQHAGQVSKQKSQLQFTRDIAIKNLYLASHLDGRHKGHLAEFLSLSTQFASKDIAMAVLMDCTPAMLQLARRVADVDEYDRIVAGSLKRHLG